MADTATNQCICPTRGVEGLVRVDNKDCPIHHPDALAREIFYDLYAHPGMPTWGDATLEVKELCYEDAQQEARNG